MNAVVRIDLRSILANGRSVASIPLLSWFINEYKRKIAAIERSYGILSSVPPPLALPEEKDEGADKKSVPVIDSSISSRAIHELRLDF